MFPASIPKIEVHSAAPESKRRARIKASALGSEAARRAIFSQGLLFTFAGEGQSGEGSTADHGDATYPSERVESEARLFSVDSPNAMHSELITSGQSSLLQIVSWAGFSPQVSLL